MSQTKKTIKSSLFSIFFLLLCMGSIIPVKSQSSINLECNTYVSEEYTVVRGDKITWSFSSTQSEISVIVLTEDQKNSFYNMLLSAGDYTILSGNLKQDSGIFKTTFTGACYIYFINWGIECEDTYLTYETSINRTGLITWIIIISLISLIGIIITVQRKKKSIVSVPYSSSRNLELPLLKKFQQLITINPQIKLETLAENLNISEARLYDYLLSWMEKLPFTIQDQHLQIENMSLVQEKLTQLILELQ